MARKRKFEAATDSEESHSDDDTPSSGYTYSSHFDSKKPKTLRKDAKESEFTSVQQQDDIVDSDPEPQHICQTHIELVEIGISKNQPIVYKPERGNNWIGRSPDSQLIADSNFVSRKKHACLVFQPFVNKLHLKDCDSTNGIYVNDEMVSVVELNEGDLIGIGCSTDHHSINNPECVVLRVTQKVIHYPNEQSTKRPQPVEPITLSSSSEDELEAPINRTSTENIVPPITSPSSASHRSITSNVTGNSSRDGANNIRYIEDSSVNNQQFSVSVNGNNAPAASSSIVTKWNVSPDDLRLVKDGGWITDSVVNACFDRFVSEANTPTVAFVPVGISQWAISSSHQSINSTLSRTEYKSAKMILFPMCETTAESTGGNHFYVIAYINSRCYYFDSDQRTGQKLKKIRDFSTYITKYLKTGRSSTNDMIAVYCSEQETDNDCGIFTILNGRMLVQLYTNQQLPRDFATNWKSLMPIDNARVATERTDLHKQLGGTTNNNPNSQVAGPSAAMNSPQNRQSSKDSPMEPEDSNSDFEQPPTKRKKTSTSAPSTQNDDNFRVTMRSNEQDVTFLGNTLKKKSTVFICPFVGPKKRKCGKEYSAFCSLQRHFEKVHKQSKNLLQKPLETDPNNLRKTQNNNKRFKMSTVKMKLTSFMVGGASVVADNRRKLAANGMEQEPTPPLPMLQQKQNEMAREVYDVIEQQAIELSKLAILFSHLVYYRIYRLIDTLDSKSIDNAFKSEVDFKLAMLKFKDFKRDTANSKIPASTGSKAGKTFATVDDTEFFEMCREHNVSVSFTEWSQNSWNYIIKTFRTNFRTNIRTHLYDRLRKWFYFRLKNGRTRKELRGKENRKLLGDKVYHTLKYLFYAEKSSKPKMVQHELIKELQNICLFPDFLHSGESYFSSLFSNDGKRKSKPKPAKKRKVAKKTKKNTTKKSPQSTAPRLIWMQMVPAMVRLQQWIHTTNSNRHQQLIDEGIIKQRKKKRKRRRRRITEAKVPELPKPSEPVKTRRTGRRRNKKHKTNSNEDDDKINYEKLANFKVVPQHSFTTKHFAIDSKSLFDVVKDLISFKTKNNKHLFTQNQFLDLEVNHEDANAKTQNPFWRFLFNVKKFETDTRKFGGRITTNSSDISVQFCRVKEDKKMTRDEVIDLANQKRKAESEDADSDYASDAEDEFDSESDHDDDSEDMPTKTDIDPAIVNKLTNMVTPLDNVSISSVDLGIRNLAATVIRTWKDSKIHESNVLHKSKDYHYKTGFTKRQRIRKRLLGTFDKRYRMDRQSGNEEPSSKNPDYRQYLRSRLKWFNEATQAYMHRQVTNLQFSKYRSSQTAMTQMAREIVGEVDVVGHKLEEKSCRIVFMGNCSTPANSTIRGHRRAPTGKKLSRYLQQRRNVIIISTPETNSTKNCSRCYEPLDNVESSKERLKICSKFCTPARDSMPAHHITSYTSKRSIKRKMKNVGTKPSQSERKSRVSMNRIDRWSIDDKIRIAKRLSLKRTIYVGPIPARHNILWNRDINAARNINYLGLCRYGKFIDSSLNTTENTAFSRSTSST